MSPWTKLIIRIILSAGLAVIMSRFFYQRLSYPLIIGLIIFFVGMATLSERLSRKP